MQGSSSSTEPIAIVDDERFERHRDPSGPHAESPERLLAARSGLYAAIPEAQRQPVTARAATEQELLRVHQASYLKQLQNALGRGEGLLDADTYFCRDTRLATWLAAGSAAELATRLWEGPTRRGVALLRPPGHHAEPDVPMGFCMLNNVAVAAAAVIAAGAQRVAVVDFDVHHGNGTQTAFYRDPRVLFISLHQYPFYPGTGRPDEIGEGEGRGFNANLALPPEQGPETYGYAFRRVVLPLLRQFRPELVLVSAGFDAHRRDPLADMMLDDEMYAAMTSALCELAEECGHGRVGLLLEGGYDLQALEGSMHGAARALSGAASALPEDRPSAAGRDAIEVTRSVLKRVWQLDGDRA